VLEALGIGCVDRKTTRRLLAEGVRVRGPGSLCFSPLNDAGAHRYGA
jgi:hypothetical protein